MTFKEQMAKIWNTPESGVMAQSAITTGMVDRAASVLWCHAQYKGDVWTARTLARAMLEAAILKPKK